MNSHLTPNMLAVLDYMAETKAPALVRLHGQW